MVVDAAGSAVAELQKSTYTSTWGCRVLSLLPPLLPANSTPRHTLVLFVHAATMVQSDRIEVRLVRHSDSTRYTEYALPPHISTALTGTGNEVYIEAVAGERFAIELKLLRGFKFKDHPKVLVQYFLDGDKCISTNLSKRKHQDAEPGTRSQLEDTLSTSRCFIDGQWMVCGLAFGELSMGKSNLAQRGGATFSHTDINTGDEAASVAQQVAQEANSTARIVVRITRGKLLSNNAPRSTYAHSAHTPWDVACERDNQQHSTSSTVKYDVPGLIITAQRILIGH